MSLPFARPIEAFGFRTAPWPGPPMVAVTIRRAGLWQYAEPRDVDAIFAVLSMMADPGATVRLGNEIYRAGQRC